MEHLWTPWRSTYMKEKKDKSVCIFCAAIQDTNDRETLVLHRARYCFVILNRYPYTSGHLMIAPFAHVSRLTAIADEASTEMMQLARFSETILEKTYRPDGLNLGMNLGEAAGAGIEQHIHLHVLPRWKGDANFMTTIGETRIIPEALDVTYDRLVHEFAALKP